ncbi:hypothetical protein Taro_045746 [Colocasia esculenta]|uniref:Uncharacterized protein n=1 Tax=Colocasia esculenta TaxID=4460 RepID=A0A843WXB7_COLES|nr:hypothetical protein [Colocasia esculenta]
MSSTIGDGVLNEAVGNDDRLDDIDLEVGRLHAAAAAYHPAGDNMHMGAREMICSHKIKTLAINSPRPPFIETLSQSPAPPARLRSSLQPLRLLPSGGEQICWFIRICSQVTRTASLDLAFHVASVTNWLLYSFACFWCLMVSDRDRGKVFGICDLKDPGGTFVLYDLDL